MACVCAALVKCHAAGGAHSAPCLADRCREGDGERSVLQPTLGSRLHAGERRLAVGHVAQLSGGRDDLGLRGRLSLRHLAHGVAACTT